MLPAAETEDDARFMAFMLEDKIGVTKLPVTGNPFLASALIVHPQGVRDTLRIRYLFFIILYPHVVKSDKST